MLASVLLLADLVVATDALAQQGRGRGWSPGSPYDCMYDPTTAEIWSGVVVQVKSVAPRRGMSGGIHVVLKTETETVPVHLGPAWFIENQDRQIQEGDEIEVLGSRITFENEPAILAAGVRLGEETLRLRDQSGLPVWRGWQRQR